MADITINAGITKIDYPTAYALIESGKCILLDIREKEECQIPSDKSEGLLVSII